MHRAPCPPCLIAFLVVLPSVTWAQVGAEPLPCGGSGVGAPDIDVAFGQVELLLPAPGAVAVPRNVELRLSADPDALVAQGFAGPLRVVLEDASGAQVPITRHGARVRPDALFEPDSLYRVVVADEACPECMPSFDFMTGTEVDVSAPRLADELVTHLFIAPQDPACPVSSHALFVDVGSLHPDVAWLEIAAAGPDGIPQPLRSTPARWQSQFSLAVQGADVGLGDEVTLAVTPIDLAGNEGSTRIVRTRARSFTDMNASGDVWSLAPEQCSLPPSPFAHVPDLLPANGHLQVDFPFESVPLALEREGELGVEHIPLHPSLPTATSQVLEPGRPLEPGAHYTLVALECPSCVCSGCSVVANTVIEVGAADDTPPSPPAVLALDEDLDPERARGTCRPDRTALVVILEPGDDNAASALELRYDAVIRLEGGARLQVGRHLAPARRADGTVAVRLVTHSYGRLLAQAVTVELRAIDSAGNRSQASTFEHDPTPVSGGCSATKTVRGAALPSGLAGLVLALSLSLSLHRRR